MVLKFISALLRANRNEQQEFYARQIPRGVFKTDRPEIKWIYDYRESHGAYPSLAAFKARFINTIIPKHSEPVALTVQTVLDRSTYEELTGTISKARELYEGGSAISSVVGYMRNALQGVSVFDAHYEDVDLAKSPVALRRYIERVRSRAEGNLNVDPSPWKTYNELVGFCEWGESNIIASRTSIGKTWLLVAWADHFRRRGERVLVVTKEMPTHQIADRFEAYVYGLNYPLFRRGSLLPKDLRTWKDARRSGNFWDQGNLVVTGEETIRDSGFQHVISKIEQYKPTVFFLDGAYLIYPENLKNPSLPERIMRISNVLKRLAKVYKMISFATIQGKREAENKEGETSVSLKDLFGGDAWAQDADNVLLINGRRDSKIRRLSLAKGRESAIGEFHVAFRLEPHPFFGQVRGAFTTGSSGTSVEFKTL